jgi:1,4-alpha-glucan branching enzyme
LERAARELLALQSSDWAFQLARRQAGDYPLERARGHSAALDAALAESDSVPDPAVRALQPQLDLSPLVLP